MEIVEVESDDDYTQQDVYRFLSKFNATTADYLIRTYFEIFKINSGPLYEKWARRLNNIILNNFSEIYPILISMIFVPRSLQIVKENLDHVHFYSILYPNIIKTDNRPVIIQYFDTKEGIRHGMLEYLSSPSSISTLMIEYNIEKVIGFCGDYGYKDSITLNTSSDHVQSLRILSGNKVLDLPYSDGFLRRLFDILLDYLPVDVIKPIIKLGETMIHLGATSSFQNKIIFQYRKWLQSDTYILGSDYVQFIIDKFETISFFMRPYHFLPSCVVDCFQSLRHKILLIFMKKLYAVFQDETISDNSAVSYFLYLNNIRNMFQRFSQDRIFLRDATNCLSTEIEFLVATKQLDENRDCDKINSCMEDIVKGIDLTFSRAVLYIDALLNKFENFQMHTWILLDKKVSFRQVHTSYHTLLGRECDNCDILNGEVNILNNIVAKLPFLQAYTLAGRWVEVFRESHNRLPSFEVIIEVLLSFPCSSEFLKLSGSELENITTFNMGNVNQEEIVNDINVFFSDYLEEADGLINNNQVTFLED